jgi:hypothetical protein
LAGVDDLAVRPRRADLYEVVFFYGIAKDDTHRKNRYNLLNLRKFRRPQPLEKFANAA